MPLDPVLLPPSLRRVYDLRMQGVGGKHIGKALDRSPHGVDCDISKLRKMGAEFPELDNLPPLEGLAERIVRLRQERRSYQAIRDMTGCSESQLESALRRASRRGATFPRVVKSHGKCSAGKPATVRIIGRTEQGFRRRVLAWDESEARAAWDAGGGTVERVERV